MSTSTERAAVACQVCGTTRRNLLRPAGVVRPALRPLITEAHGGFDEQGWICLDDLQFFQQRYVRSMLEAEKGELTDLETEVLRGLHEQEILARNPDVVFEAERTFGQRMADAIAEFGGSWGFILTFLALLCAWIAVNSFLLISGPFDPYPYILLNLLLSTLAALQAPVIMMSQKRQEARDRERAMHDYQVNLKAELEIRQLHQKVDHLLSHQWERLVEIQQIQMELINEVRARR